MIVKSQQQGTREGKNGRLYEGTYTEWLVIIDGELVGTYQTKREAKERETK